MPLTPSTEFRRHAAECNRMARSAADRASKQVWKNLAERWLTCASLAERDETMTPRPKERRRRRVRHFSH
jgi:hypothetical protein